MDGVISCALCELVDGLATSLVVASDAHWVTFVHPSLAEGNCLWVQTRQHVEGVWSMTEEQTALMGSTLRRAANALRHTKAAERVYVVSFGENFSHMHGLVIARLATAADGGLRGTALVDAVMRRMGEPDVARAVHVAATLRPGFV